MENMNDNGKETVVENNNNSVVENNAGVVVENNNSTNENNKESEKKNRFWIIAFFLAIPLFTCFGIFISNNFLSKPSNSTIGDFDVVDKPQDNTPDDSVARDSGTITFAGYGKYEVSKNRPNIEIKNPIGNFVDMVFILKDEATGEIIAKTDKVKAGKYVYVNVMNYYKKTGNYTIILNTLTYDSESGAQMNGMNQKIDITI